MQEIPRIIMALAQKGFTVTALTGDGASENRSCFKKLCTDGVNFKDLYETELEEGLKACYKHINFDWPIGFYHPSDPDVIIFIHADMPHLIKKF